MKYGLEKRCLYFIGRTAQKCWKFAIVHGRFEDAIMYFKFNTIGHSGIITF